MREDNTYIRIMVLQIPRHRWQFILSNAAYTDIFIPNTGIKTALVRECYTFNIHIYINGLNGQSLSIHQTQYCNSAVIATFMQLFPENRQPYLGRGAWFDLEGPVCLQYKRVSQQPYTQNIHENCASDRINIFTVKTSPIFSHCRGW